VFPPFIGVLLMVSVVFNLVAFFLQSGDVLATLIGLLGTVSTAIAYGWVGMSLMQQPKAIGVEASSPQAVLR
jgi:hypothetical protein